MSAAPRVVMRMHRHSGRPAQAYGKTSVAEKKELDECLAPGGRNNIVGKEARYLKGVYFSVVPAFVLRTRFVTTVRTNPCPCSVLRASLLFEPRSWRLRLMMAVWADHLCTKELKYTRAVRLSRLKTHTLLLNCTWGLVDTGSQGQSLAGNLLSCVGRQHSRNE